jgi:hypothetical protein
MKCALQYIPAFCLGGIDKVVSKQTVRPEKWREIVNGHIGTAQQYRYELEQSERPEMNRYHDAPTYAGNLIETARRVFQVTDTLVGSPRPWPWYDAWLARLTPAERTLWGTMRDTRDADIHGEGADLVEERVPLPPGADGLQTHGSSIVLGIPPADRGKGPAKSTVRWRAYPNRPASAVGGEYIELCRRFAADFERDHQKLIGSKTP